MTAVVHDVLLRGGAVVDGLGAPPRRADVAVSGSRITEVAVLPTDARARRVLHVEGHYLLPGFVDTHVHADAMAFDSGMQLAALRQGVTTLMTGQDGVSFAPSDQVTADYVDAYFGAVNGRHVRLGSAACTVSELLARYDRATPFNVGYLAPHGTIRHRVLGTADRAADRTELQSMRRLLCQALEDGAFGLSTGLEYVPGCHADVDECTDLCSLVAAAGGIHVTHLRGYDADTHLDEACAVTVTSGCPTHVSHYRGAGARPTRALDEALSRGVDLSFDSYPYLRSSTLLAVSALPRWIQTDGPGKAVQSLRDPQVRAHLRRDWFPSVRDLLEESVLSYVPAAAMAWAEGMTPAQAAAEADTEFTTFLCDLFVESRMEVGAVLGTASGASEAGMRWLLRHRVHMAGSDGIYLGSRPHPRGWGAFARYLGRHTRDLGDYDWSAAAEHLAARAASRFGLVDRGVLRAGAFADIAVIDPDSVRDEATYESPRRLATGVRHVLVNGAIALLDEESTGAMPGASLRLN